MDEIINKVKNSSLIQIDLAEFKPKQEIIELDLKEQLWQGLALKEKDFRQYISENNWEEFEGKVVAVHCSADAIIPTWAYMLVVSKLAENNILAFTGDKSFAMQELIKKAIDEYKVQDIENGKFIIKGCADIPDPAYAMSELTKKLIPVASSIMYGEPCSTVPVYKRKKVR